MIYNTKTAIFVKKLSPRLLSSRAGFKFLLKMWQNYLVIVCNSLISALCCDKNLKWTICFQKRPFLGQKQSFLKTNWSIKNYSCQLDSNLCLKCSKIIWWKISTFQNLPLGAIRPLNGPFSSKNDCFWAKNCHLLRKIGSNPPI